MAKTKDRYEEIKKKIAEEKDAAIELRYTVYDIIKTGATTYAIVEITHDAEVSNKGKVTIVEKDLYSLAKALSVRDNMNMKENIQRMKKGL